MLFCQNQQEWFGTENPGCHTMGVELYRQNPVFSRETVKLRQKTGGMRLGAGRIRGNLETVRQINSA
jgi:hypothetical protein